MNKIFNFNRPGFLVSFVLITAQCLMLFAAVASGQTKPRKAAKAFAADLTPVVLIHGIGGSDLRRVVPNSERAQKRDLLNDGFPHDVLKISIIPLGKAADPRNLQFDESGAPRADTSSKIIQATAFYDVPLSRNITDLSKYLQTKGYTKATGVAVDDKNANLFEFYYDFRYSVPQTATLLADFVNRIKLQTGKPQVDLIGHSMGGMVIKQYVSNTENADGVRTIIFAATPHLGAPKALKALRYGDNLGVKLFDECKLKRAVHNMPSMFNLLPGRRYFEVAGGGYFTDARDLDDDKIVGELDYEQTVFNLKEGKETRCLMKPDKNDAPPFDRLSSDLVRINVEEFRGAQDDWKKPANTKVFAIAGYNISTLKKIKEDGAQITYTYTTEGDGTVPLESAETCDADEIYYADFRRLKTDHAQMIGSPEINAQIFNLLNSGAGIYIGGLSTARPDSAQFKIEPQVDRFIAIKPSGRPLKRTIKRRVRN